MARESYRVQGIVIRTYDFGEADRIIVLLTKNHGLVRGVAKGVRRAKSRFGSRLQPFVELDLTLYKGRNLESITSADTLKFLATGIIEHPERYFAASAILEATERLASSDIYPLTIWALEEMRSAENPTLMLDIFLLHAMNIAGWAPSLYHCASCQTPGPHHAFHPAPGGAVCVHCRVPGTIEVDEETLHIMWQLTHKQPVVAISTQHARNIHRLTEAHFHWHTERTLASLKVLDQA
ncbi:DNA repair protein RecO [Corynebacterium felinum]|uniref:DNA repair protein RecO n=1 Tax=Corynebacterium felinum TaxID=131318 RepID=A0ABU2B4C2_9CORY|nr:DNA repair protein RecO [Corynebacterium felinum]MDF5822001.1 DNA repair protein RecO [Corynebacterium felinum]MDR7353469.1 DNA repair protein RecO (recombination protein O) [Corynebacterium felinum]WJY95649.1 DNA repair protein RecO [Corynebacterium felinum]